MMPLLSKTISKTPKTEYPFTTRRLKCCDNYFNLNCVFYLLGVLFSPEDDAVDAPKHVAM
jgi:hypothetical protein